MLEKDEKQEVHVDDRRDSKADAAAEIQKLYSQMRAGRKKSGSMTSIGSPAGVLKLEKPPAIPEGRYCKYVHLHVLHVHMYMNETLHVCFLYMYMYL